MTPPDAPEPYLHIPALAQRLGGFAAERTLHDWFRPYRANRTPAGYPLDLILRVLQDHGWRGADADLATDATDAAAQESQALAVPERAVLAVLEQYRALEGHLATIAAQQSQQSQTWDAALRDLRASVAAVAADQTERVILRREVEQLRAEVAALRARRPWWRRLFAG